MKSNGAATVLETRNLSKNFGGVMAAHDIDFAMKVGELRCLIGPNGAGKTTFFNMINGIVRPTRGSVYFHGRDITNLASYKIGRLGIVRSFQVPNVFGTLSVFENVFTGVLRKVETINPFVSLARFGDLVDRAMDVLERVRLSGKTHVEASKLSHGERRRLELGISFACDPKLLLLDEPTAGLTISETDEIIPLIEDISSRGVSILVIEHDLKFVRRIAHRITVMNKGEILAEGVADEIENDEKVKAVYLGGMQEWY